MSIATALTALADDIDAAKAAITAKGGTAPIGTADMADAIAAIPSGGITPSGSLDITENGTYDVTEYAEAVVDVSGGGGGEYVFTDLPLHNLPTGYTEYLYLENSGTQYIDTGVVSNDLPTVETWAMRTNGTNDADIMGVSTAAEGGFIVNVGTNGLFYRYGTASSTPFRWNESGISAANFTVWQHIRYSTTVKADMDLAFGAETTSATLGNFSNNTQSLLLFRGRDSIAHMRFGATKIYNGATLVRHLIPCMRNSDSILGMYDIINDAFYTNAGTGTFTGGALS